MTVIRRTEKQVVRDVRRVLELYGYSVDDMSQPRRSMMPLGLPDLRARHWKFRRRFWVEVKAPDGKLTEGQKSWHAMERQAGGLVFVVHSGSEMLEELNKLHGDPLDAIHAELGVPPGGALRYEGQ